MRTLNSMVGGFETETLFANTQERFSANPESIESEVFVAVAWSERIVAQVTARVSETPALLKRLQDVGNEPDNLRRALEFAVIDAACGSVLKEEQTRLAGVPAEVVTGIHETSRCSATRTNGELRGLRLAMTHWGARMWQLFKRRSNAVEAVKDEPNWENRNTPKMEKIRRKRATDPGGEHGRISRLSRKARPIDE